MAFKPGAVHIDRKKRNFKPSFRFSLLYLKHRPHRKISAIPDTSQGVVSKANGSEFLSVFVLHFGRLYLQTDGSNIKSLKGGWLE